MGTRVRYQISPTAPSPAPTARRPPSRHCAPAALDREPKLNSLTGRHVRAGTRGQSRGRGARDRDVAPHAVVGEAQRGSAAGDLVGERLFDQMQSETPVGRDANRWAIMLGPTDV